MNVAEVTANPKILLVDDDPLVLSTVVRILRSSFETYTAESGEAGLVILEEQPNLAVVISDMRMPKMSGATFLSRARAMRPDAVRVLLTGGADYEEAIDAVNNGNLFRFIRKPFDAVVLKNALDACMQQRRLILSERTLLEDTLRGAIQALCDTLALTNPVSFGLGTRVKQLAVRMGTELGVTNLWRIEVAAMVAQLGVVSVPLSVFERKAKGEPLTIEERAMLDRVPEITDKLLAPIPRIEDIRAFVREAHSRTHDKATASLEAKILRTAFDFIELESAIGVREKALEILQLRHAHYDLKVLAALGELIGAPERVVELALEQLREGMTVAADVKTKNGMLLVTRGHEVTAAMLGRLMNFASSLATRTVHVIERT